MRGIHPVLAVIPARGGSKGLPGKNLRELAGLPLIAHSIACARMTPEVARVIVSTDDAEIAAVARGHGAEVPFVRPAELASDTAAMWPVLQHALRSAEQGEGTHYGSLLLLDPTSPGRLPSDVAQAVAKLAEDPEADGVVGVSEPDFNPFWHAVVEEHGYMRDLITGADKYERRQDLPRVYRINATLYLWRCEFVLDAPGWRDGRHRLQVVPERRALHIDDIGQFELAELLIRSGLVRLPWLEGA